MTELKQQLGLSKAKKLTFLVIVTTTISDTCCYSVELPVYLF